MKKLGPGNIPDVIGTLDVLAKTCPDELAVVIIIADRTTGTFKIFRSVADIDAATLILDAIDYFNEGTET